VKPKLKIQKLIIGGQKIKEIRDDKGRLHCLNKPALVVKDLAGNKLSKKWYCRGLLHREDGPAEIIYSHKGKISYAVWYFYGTPVWADTKISSKLKAEYILKKMGYN